MELQGQPVTITDVDIPFGRLVVLILKLMVASIPAILLFYAFLAVVMLFVALVFGSLGAMFNSFG
jgi:hypothetical protein